ncbi:MAG: hypothetical protein KIS76_07345 [Pyrinomonadaceae bacterium]|nr:hypothetical protein [Pyrinomonadaceae bacterium]
MSLLLSFACQKNSVTSDIFPKDSTIPKDLEITYEQTECKGSCWVYNLKIEADGTIKYEGVANVEKLGKFEDKLSDKQIRELINEFKKADYFDLEDNYVKGNCPIVVTDSPTAITSLRLNGKAKKITHYLGCLEEERNHVISPQKLYSLERRINVITDSFRWTGTK